MKLWIGLETQKEAVDKFRLVRVYVEKKINEAISDKEYSLSLDAWDVVIILRDDSSLKEMYKYSPKKKEMDFRVIINYQEFMTSDEHGCRKLLFSALIHSLTILKDKIAEPIDVLFSDVNAVGVQERWC